MTSDIVFRPALYLGSIPFEADKLSRAAFVRSKLEVLQNFSFYKPVMLCISTSGVKVCDPECKTIYMAHALRRISYATCDPYSSKFAFLAREANSETPCQYCHIFGTETQFQAEELNAIIGDAFKLAYAKQRLHAATSSTQRSAAHGNSSAAGYGGTEGDHSTLDAGHQLPPLTSLHSAELIMPPPTNESEGENAPPLYIPPPPPTTPPPPPPDSDDPEQEIETRNKSCSGNSRIDTSASGLQRHCLVEEEDKVRADKPMEASVSVAIRQRAFSDPRVPDTKLLEQQPLPTTKRGSSHVPPNAPIQQQQLVHPSVRHSVAFFDSPSPNLAAARGATAATAGVSGLSFAPPLSPLPAIPVSIKDKHRAIFDLPLGDHRLNNSAASPVVALKTHLDSLANGSKQQQQVLQKRHQRRSKGSSAAATAAGHLKKGELASASSASSSNSVAAAAGASANPVVSRFRLRQNGGGGGGHGGGGKKRQLERPLSQIICQLDSALLLNNSPSFSVVVPRSEERISAVVAAASSSSTVAEEGEGELELEEKPKKPVQAEEPEEDMVEGIPRALVECLDDLDNAPVPPLRVHSLHRSCASASAFVHHQSSSSASPHGSRGPLQSLSESSDLSSASHCRNQPRQTSGEDNDYDRDDGEADGEEEEVDFGDVDDDDDDPEAVEFAILEAVAAAEAEAEERRDSSSSSNNNHGERKKTHHGHKSHRQQQLGDVCPVPTFADHLPSAWQRPASNTQAKCGHHAGFEPQCSSSTTTSPHHHQNSNGGKHSSAACGAHANTNNNSSSADWWGAQNGSRFTPVCQQQQQPSVMTSSHWTVETPTPTATPTPTPTPAPLLHQPVSGGPQHSPPWFQAYLPREVALELLTHEETGSFLVRDSVTQPGCWALSVRVPANINCLGITHYLIQRSKNGVKLKGLDKEWPSLEALITHLTVMPEMLPCPLRLPPSAHHPGGLQHHHQSHQLQTSNPIFTEDDPSAGLGQRGEEEEEEYQRLSDFSSMLADMQPLPAAFPQLFR